MLETKAFLRGTSTGIAGGFPNQKKHHPGHKAARGGFLLTMK
jgi:hypothetical protein